jgi:hypothetical protein
MLVHNCVVEVWQGDKSQVVYERGCHVDRFVLSDPTYTEALNMAYPPESSVLKFADRAGVCSGGGNGTGGNWQHGHKAASFFH